MPFTGVILSDDGRQDEPEQLFYDLESHVPRDSSAARVQRGFLDAIGKSLEPYYSSTGRPSIDPELMFRNVADRLFVLGSQVPLAQNSCSWGSSPNSSSHFLATLGAASAGVHAFFHFTDSLTIRSALFTDFAAYVTSAFVKVRADQHEMSGCPADLGARHH